MTEALRTRWLCLRLVVLDEMSMAKWGDLRRLDLFLRALTERNVPFGGVVIVLAGDFYQLGPIGCPYLLKGHGGCSMRVHGKSNHVRGQTGGLSFNVPS